MKNFNFLVFQFHAPTLFLHFLLIITLCAEFPSYLGNFKGFSRLV